MSVESLDILIVVGLLIGLVRGFATGAVRQVVSFFGTIVAIVLAVQIMNTVGRALGATLGVSESIQPIVGFIVVFLAIQVAAFFLVRLGEATIQVVRLNALNRLAGAIVGVSKAALMISVLLLILGFFDVPEEENRRQSVLYDPVASVFPTAWHFAAAHLPLARNLSDRFGKEVEAALSDSLP